MTNKANRPPEGTLRPEIVIAMRPRICERAQDSKALSTALDRLIDECRSSPDPGSQREKTA